MLKKVFAWSMVLSMLLVAVGVPGFAQGPEAQVPQARLDLPGRAPEVLSANGEVSIEPSALPHGIQSALGQAARVPYMIEMEGEPLAVVYAEQRDRGAGLMSGDGQRAYTAGLKAAQTALFPEIKALGGQVISTYQKAYNGIQVLASVDMVGALQRLPGVKAVHRIPLHAPSNGTSVPWIGAEQVWTDLGIDGTGITIAVIDSGIDYYHADFEGSGDPDDYANDDRNIVEPGTFPTMKVIGGYDFAGPDYDPESNDPDIATPDPDPDPLDGPTFGHGTHVAGTAAGVGVAGKIGPGVAPGAKLYAVKVFADVRASTGLTSDGIEWAMDPNQDGDISDHADVMNLSLGAAFGSQYDPSAIACNNAVKVGAVVAAAAGNAGHVSYIHDSPGNADLVIGVAASIDNDPEDNAVTAVSITSPYTAEYAASEGNDSKPLFETGDILDEIVYVGRGCVDTGGDTYLADPNGKIALIQRGACSFTEKAGGVEAAGALAAIIFNNAGDSLINMAVTAGIPAVFIGQTDGEEIVAEIDLGSIVNGGLVRSPLPELADTLADFTGQGPRPDSWLKPDVAAPGVQINSADVGSGSEGVKYGGTSMATPHVAGAAALLLELNPNWSPEQVKAALMNTAVDMSDVDGNDYPLTLQGAGRIDVYAAANLESMAGTATGSLSWGLVTVDSDISLLKHIKVVNHDTAAKTYDIAYNFRFAADVGQGVDLILPAQVTVDPGTYANVPVQVDIDVSELPEATYDFNAWELAEYDGFVTLTEQSTRADPDTLRVPFLIIPRPTSHTQGPASVTYQAPAPYALFGLNNTGPISSHVYLMAGYGTDINETDVADNADVRYWGLDIFGIYENGTMTDTVASFAINTYGPWHTPQPYWNEFDVYVDNDEDGSPEYVVFNFNYGAMTTGDDNNVFVPVVVDLVNGGFTVPTWPPPFGDYILTNYTEFNAATIEMGVKGIDLGLDAGNTDFDYWIVGFDYDGNADVTSVKHADLGNPAMGFLWAPPPGEVPPQDSNVAAVVPSMPGLVANDVSGILAFYYNDVPGIDQAQFIPFTAKWYTYYLPTIPKHE